MRLNKNTQANSLPVQRNQPCTQRKWRQIKKKKPYLPTSNRKLKFAHKQITRAFYKYHRMTGKKSKHGVMKDFRSLNVLCQ